MIVATRAIFDYLFGFFVSLAILPLVYNTIKRMKAKQEILEYVDMHKSKSGTPTMGGISFIFGFVVSVFVLIGGFVEPLYVCVAVMILNALVGFYDDFIKIKKHHNEGLKPYQKIIFQSLIFISFGLYLYKNNYSFIIIPFSGVSINLGFGVVFLSLILGLFFTNCTNLADGLDGLECFITMPSSAALGVVLLLFSTGGFLKDAQNLDYLTNLGYGLIIFSGAVFSFVFMNSHPAKIFMGDTGSLSIGALMVSVALITGTTIYLLIFGILFVITGVSVLMQVAYYKMTKKRIFLMAPIHHHFEKKGYHEAKISVIYFMLTTILSLIVILLELI